MDVQTSLQDPTALKAKYECLLKELRIGGENKPKTVVSQIRNLVVQYGIPNEELSTNTLRGKIWIVLFGINPSADDYFALLSRGISPSTAGEIQRDLNRIFSPSQADMKALPDLQTKVSRTLRAWAALQEERNIFNYVQGHPIKVGIFLSVMPELQAFYCFRKLWEFYCPLYYAYAGIDHALKLIPQILRPCDPALAAKFEAEPETLLICHQEVLGFFGNCGDVTSLDLLRLCDVAWTCGTHYILLFLAARFVLCRENLLNGGQSLSQWLNQTRNAVLPVHDIIMTAHLLFHSLQENDRACVIYHPFYPSVEAPKGNFKLQEKDLAAERLKFKELMGGNNSDDWGDGSD